MFEAPILAATFNDIRNKKSRLYVVFILKKKKVTEIDISCCWKGIFDPPYYAAQAVAGYVFQELFF